MHLPPLALFGDLAFQELLIVALAAVVIFGRRLPQVAGRGYAQFQRVRRTLTDTWRETGIDDELRRIQRDLDRQMPRNFDPAKLARRETREIEQLLARDEQAGTIARSNAAAKPPSDSKPAESPQGTAAPAEPAASPTDGARREE